MEVVGVVAAGQQFLVEGVKLARVIRDIRSKFKDAPQEIETWSVEIADLLALVGKVEATPELADSNVKSVIESCRTVCASLLDDFKALSFTSDDSVVTKTWRAIKGLDKEDDLRKQFEELQRLKLTLIGKISLAQFNQGHLIAEDVSYIKKVIQPGSDEDNCVQALFQTDPLNDRDSIITLKGQRVEGTCEWITSTKEYDAWIQSRSGLLWLFGSPGKGKTYLSIFLTETLNVDDSTLLFFFCDNKVATRNTAMGILRGLIHQLVDRHPALVTHLVKPWKVQRSALFNDNGFETLWRVFKLMIEDITDTPLYCVLDGLDECREDSLERLLRKIEALLDEKESKNSLKMIIVSRKYPHCLERTLGLFPKINLDDESSVKSDIDAYITENVGQLSKRRSFTQRLASQIEETFREKSQGTFLWVSFMIQDFQSKSIVSIEKALDSLPRGLDEIYERILLQIKPDNMTIIADLLRWITLTTEALTVPQLAEAVGILDSNHLTRDEICLSHLESCGHLLQVNHSTGDAENSTEWKPPTVTLVHQSAKDFLLRPFENHRLKPFQVLQSNGRVYIMEYFLNNMQTVWLACARDSENSVLKEDTAYPLASYAWETWREHLRQLDGETLLHLIETNKAFFAETSDVRDCWSHANYDIDKPQPILHFACVNQLVPLVEKLLRRKRLNPLKFQKYLDKKHPTTSLALAVETGNLALVEMLLRFGATVDTEYTSNNLQTHVLRLGCKHGRYEIFEALAVTKDGARYLKKDSTLPEPRDLLLHHAASFGNEPVCKFLIEKYGYKVESLGEKGRTPLILALEHSHYDLVRMLAEKWGAKISPPDQVIDCLMGAITLNNHTAVPMELIFPENGTSINYQLSSGSTILHTTMKAQVLTSRDHYDFLRQCLAYGGDPSIRDKQGNTPLHVMKCFLTQPGSMIAGTNLSQGLFPIRCVALLLLDGRLDINTTGQHGYTLLHRYIEDSFDVKVSEHNVDQARRIEGMSKILDLGADRHLRTSLGVTPVELVRQCHDKSQDKEGREGYRGDAVADLLDVLENYSTVPNSPSNLSPLDYEYSKEARSIKGFGPYGACSVM